MRMKTICRKTYNSQKSTKGYVFVYALVLFIYIFCIVFSNALLINLPEINSDHLTGFLWTFIPFAGLLYIEWRRDKYECMLFLSFVFLASAPIFFIMFAYGYPLFYLFQGIFLLFFGVLMFWKSRRSQVIIEDEEVLNFLRINFDEKGIMEIKGVQFVVVSNVVSDNEFEIKVFVQNCHFDEREVLLKIQDSRWHKISGSNMPSFHKEIKIMIQPLSVELISVPVLSPMSGKKFKLNVNLESEWPKGLRLRLWRGKVVSSENPGLFQQLSLMVSPYNIFLNKTANGININFPKSPKISKQNSLNIYEIENLWLPEE